MTKGGHPVPGLVAAWPGWRPVARATADPGGVPIRVDWGDAPRFRPICPPFPSRSSHRAPRIRTSREGCWPFPMSQIHSGRASVQRRSVRKVPLSQHWPSAASAARGRWPRGRQRLRSRGRGALGAPRPRSTPPRSATLYRSRCQLRLPTRCATATASTGWAGGTTPPWT